MTTSSVFSMQCLARTSCDRCAPLFASISSVQAAQFSRSICCPRQDIRVIPGEGQSPASNVAGFVTSQISSNYHSRQGCSRRPENVVCRSKDWQPNFSYPFRPAGANGGTTIPSVSANYFVLVFSVSKMCGQPAFVRADSHAAI